MSQDILIVTGGGSGIGFQCLVEFLRQSIKNKVVLVDKQILENLKQDLKKEFGEERLLYIEYDLFDHTNLNKIFDLALTRFGSFNILLNNAGIGLSEQIELDSLSDQEQSFLKVDQIIDLNLKTQIKLTILASYHLRKLKPSNPLIINVASLGGLFPQGSAPIYCSSKHGLVGFSKSLLHYKNEYNIRINTICPGFVETPLVISNMQKSKSKNSNNTNQITQITPGTLIKKQLAIHPSKVAEVFIKLVQDNTAHGQIVLVSAAIGVRVQQTHKIPSFPGESKRGGYLQYVPSDEELLEYQKKQKELKNQNQSKNKSKL